MSSNTDMEMELERLRAEIAQENKMKLVLEESVRELQLTCDELEARLDGIDDESNEWKTRYETQCEMNQQLEKQSMGLQDRIDEAKKTLREGLLPKSVRDAAHTEVTVTQLSQLEREKRALDSQLKDLEWKLDQESKAYHQANEERNHYVTEINSMGIQIKANRNKSINLLTNEKPKMIMGNQNIPNDQRLLNPQYPPIKKTAATKVLPRLN